MKIPKLMAPVRDEGSLWAAIQGGAEVVYAGLGEMDMRASAEGLKEEVLGEMVSEAHKAGVEVFITLNSIVYEGEIGRVRELVARCKEAGVDRVVAWDWAVIEECGRQGVGVQVSTQASVSNSEAARFYERRGVRGVVLARECSLEQIKEIKDKVGIEVEVFCHGSMCVAVSGRCFLSEFWEGCSANRGECKQVCRRRFVIREVEEGKELEVGERFVMSPKDLCTLRVLDKLVGAGVDMLKIEGRGRSAEYIRTVTEAYREGLDLIKVGGYGEKEKDRLMRKVERVYNRGFSEGFLFGRPGSEGWAECSQSKARERKEYVGKVTNYFGKRGVVEVQVQGTRSLEVGEEVYVQGNKTGSERVGIKELRKFEGGYVTFPCARKLRRNDAVYKIIARGEEG